FRRLPPDLCAGGAGLLDHAVHLGWGSEVERQRRAAPAAAILDAAVLREPGAVPERDDHLASLEEDDVIFFAGAGLPAQGFVEAARPPEVAHPEGDQTDALLHGDRVRRRGLPAAGPLGAARSRLAPRAAVGASGPTAPAVPAGPRSHLPR